MINHVRINKYVTLIASSNDCHAKDDVLFQVSITLNLGIVFGE